MKVLLINPPYKEVYSKVPSAAGIAPPLGLAYIAGYLRENGVEVKILDAEALEVGFSSLKDHLEGYDMVGIGSMTPSFNNTLKVFKLVKEVNPKCHTVLGGCHISALPKETLENYTYKIPYFYIDI